MLAEPQGAAEIAPMVDSPPATGLTPSTSGWSGRKGAKWELDRFCDAMISIRREIAAIESGAADAEDNLLKNAPHTHHLLLGDWTHPYSRQEAFFPLDALREDKYWPPVGRIDNVAGDRHLVCTCPPMEAYQKEAAE